MRFEWYLRPLKSSDDGVRQAKHMDLLATVAVWESALSPTRGWDVLSALKAIPEAQLSPNGSKTPQFCLTLSNVSR